MGAAKVLQTELHRHLDVSLRMSTLYEFAQAKGLVSTSTSLEGFTRQILLTEPLDDLAAVLEKFTFVPKVLMTPEQFERVGFEVAEDCYREGTRIAELRFSPSFVTEINGLPWDAALDGFWRGLQRAMRTYPDLKAGLICIASRDFGEGAAAETVDFYLKHLDKFIGVDLAGNEVDFPCRMFEGAFKPAIQARKKDPRVHITIHSGEASGPENMWEAIELLGAERIGHGIQCVRDPKLVEHLRDRKITLEVCPTSNVLTRCVDSFESHPLARLLHEGVPVTVNTDDPGVFGVFLPDELNNCRKRLGLSDSEMEQMQRYAMEASFLQ